MGTEARLASSESWDSISSIRSCNTPSVDFSSARGHTWSHTSEQQRGGSPLTVYGGDQVPFAVNFKEVVDASIKPQHEKFVYKYDGLLNIF